MDGGKIQMIPTAQIPPAERYNELERRLKTLTFGTPEHLEVWRELESIKNNNGGMVPAEKE